MKADKWFSFLLAQVPMSWLFQQKNVALGIMNYSIHLLFQVPEDRWTSLQIFWEERWKQHFNKDLDLRKSSSFIGAWFKRKYVFCKSRKICNVIFYKDSKRDFALDNNSNFAVEYQLTAGSSGSLLEQLELALTWCGAVLDSSQKPPLLATITQCKYVHLLFVMEKILHECVPSRPLVHWHQLCAHLWKHACNLCHIFN